MSFGGSAVDAELRPAPPIKNTDTKLTVDDKFNALILPVVSSAIGGVMQFLLSRDLQIGATRDLLQPTWVRNLASGCIFVVLRELWTLVYMTGSLLVLIVYKALTDIYGTSH